MNSSDVSNAIILYIIVLPKKCDNSVDPGMLYGFGFYKGAFFCNLEVMKPKPPLPGACHTKIFSSNRNAHPKYA